MGGQSLEFGSSAEFWRWRGPCHQHSRWGQMKLPPCKTSVGGAGRRSGNSSQLLLPEPIFHSGNSQRQWRGRQRSNGHDVDRAVEAWLGPHAFLRPGELARFSWEWVTSDGNGNPDRAAIVLHPVEESRSIVDRHHSCSEACSSSATCTASTPEPLHWRAGCLLASFPPSDCRPRSCSLLHHREMSAGRAATHRTIRRCLGPETVVDRDCGQGKMEIRGCDATPREVGSPTR